MIKLNVEAIVNLNSMYTFHGISSISCCSILNFYEKLHIFIYAGFKASTDLVICFNNLILVLNLAKAIYIDIMKALQNFNIAQYITGTGSSAHSVCAEHDAKLNGSHMPFFLLEAV